MIYIHYFDIATRQLYCFRYLENFIPVSSLFCNYSKKYIEDVISVVKCTSIPYNSHCSNLKFMRIIIMPCRKHTHTSKQTNKQTKTNTFFILSWRETNITLRQEKWAQFPNNFLCLDKFYFRVHYLCFSTVNNVKPRLIQSRDACVCHKTMQCFFFNFLK